MKIAPLAAAALLALAACSKPAPNAHQGSDGHSASMNGAGAAPEAAGSAATKGYKQSMARMMESPPAYTGDADVDFNKQMRIHHLAAIAMAEVQLAHGKDPESRALATRIIAEQKSEVAQIDAWLQKKAR